MTKTIDAMIFQNDQLVQHPNLGVGKVLSVEGDRLTIYFKNDGVTRKMSATHSPLEVPAIQQDPSFDGIKLSVSKTKKPTIRKRPPSASSKPADKYPTHEAAVEGFRKAFPLGFDDPKYLADSKTGERAYKVKAHELWNSTLNKQEFERLIEAGDFDEIVQRAKKVEAGVNLLHPQFERAPLWASIGDPQTAEKFSRSLYDFIYGEDELEARFDRFAAMLDQLPQSKASLKWPAITLFPFVAHPSQFLFMRPEVTKKAARRLGFSLNYNTSLNWSSYSSLMNLGNLLLKELTPLGARDMIDVQSFIVVTGKDNYPGT